MCKAYLSLVWYLRVLQSIHFKVVLLNIAPLWYAPICKYETMLEYLQYNTLYLWSYSTMLAIRTVKNDLASQAVASQMKKSFIEMYSSFTKSLSICLCKASFSVV